MPAVRSLDCFVAIRWLGCWVTIKYSTSINRKQLQLARYVALHYQVRPFSEIKLVRCIRGRVWDVCVDLRKESPTFLKWFGAGA